jgi:DNA-binding SARP family transcriptional activator
MLQIYLIMLDKMMGYSEARGQYEKGLAYGQRILRHDRARECTHRRLMRMYYLNGDRSTALRQYERCATALQEELDVGPSKRTTALYEQIRTDRWGETASVQREPRMEDVLQSLQRLQTSLAQVQRRMERAEEAVGAVMRKQ